MDEKHRIVFDDHLRNIHNAIKYIYKVRNLKYAKCVCEMFDIDWYLSPNSNNSEKFDDYN